MSTRPNLLQLRAGPPVLWRTSRWCLALACVSAAAAVTLGVIRSQLPRPRPPSLRYAIMAFGLAPLAVIFPAGMLLQRGVRRAWRRHDGRLCPHCAHCVVGMPDRGMCPECGGEYDLPRDAELWSAAGLEPAVQKSSRSPATIATRSSGRSLTRW